MEQASDGAGIELLQILSTEIARDGGASRVGMLKDYVTSSNHLDKLLRQSVGSKKLLTFLEHHGSIFHVDRRTVPHFVKLISDQCVCLDLLETNPTSRAQREHELYNKLVYVVRKRAAKQARRQTQTTSTVDRKACDMEWLLKECALVLHFYLRATGYYQTVYTNCHEVKQLGTGEWRELALPPLRTFLKGPWKPLVMDEATGKVWLDEEDESKSDIRKLVTQMATEVEEDGGSNICLSLLLVRKPYLQALLGGRDLLKMSREHTAEFSELSVSKVGTDLHLQTKSMATKEGRMLVDEIGLFSVTSSKWGTAMTNILSSGCVDQNMHVRTAIDLTASVGGITLALAKAFPHVIAVEVDSRRAQLCRQNMIKHDASNVHVRNEDSVQLIPDLGAGMGEQATVIFLDPPWGGIHCKHERPPIAMGSWLLGEVVQLIAEHFQACIVGLKLPLDFRVHDFLDKMRHGSNLDFATLTIRRLGPQLFVALVFAKKRKLIIGGAKDPTVNNLGQASPRGSEDTTRES